MSRAVAAAASLPLRRGSPDDLQALQRLFDRAGFLEPAVCDRLKIKFAHEVDRRAARLRLAAFEANDPQAVLIRLFVLGVLVPPAALDEAFDAAERAALHATDLVRIGTIDDAPRASCPVRLMPVTTSGVPLILAGDRELGVEGSPVALPPDVVFPPHSFLTRQFLSVLPKPSDGSVLDLCTGSGVAALLVGRTVRRVAAVDIAARSAHFAAFNAWLNDAPQVESIEGDLYEPLRGERFRTVVAHPPYVPTFRPTAIFRDGGELGDVVIRRIVEGLPAHLEVGGTLYLVCMGMDTAEGPFEKRTRAWMGAEGEAFDIIFAITPPRTAEGFAAQLADGAINPDPGEEERRLALFRERGVSGVVHGALVARRLEDGVEGETHRVKLDSSSTAESFEWLFRWIAAGRQPGFADRLLASRPKLIDGTTLDVGNVVEQGEVVPRTYRLGNRGTPFPAKIETDPWVVRLVMSLDGRHSLAEAIDRLRQDGYLPEQFAKADADRLIRFLAERGLIDVDPTL